MFKTITKTLCFTLLLLVPASFAHADQKWVAITLLSGGPATTTGEYDGLIDSSVYDAITNKLEDKGLFQISSVFWIGADGKPVKMKDLQINGVKNGYSDTVFFRQDYITRIILLDQQYINTLLGNK